MALHSTRSFHLRFHGSALSMGYSPVNPVSPPLVRKPVSTFSDASRRRLKNTLYRLPWWHAPTELFFVTLTYRASDRPSGEESKRHLHNFRRSLLRAFPSAEAVWKREYTKAGVTHFMLLIRPVPGVERSKGDLERMRRLVAEWWMRATGYPEGLPEGYRVGVEFPRSTNGMVRYFADYFSKREGGDKAYQETVPEGEWSGRWWGVWGSPDLLPDAGARLTGIVYGAVWDFVQRWLAEQGSAWRLPRDHSVVINDPQLVRAVVDLVSAFPDEEVAAVLPELLELSRRLGGMFGTVQR